MRLRRPVASSIAGLILGGVLIVVMTAILTAGVSGLRADARTKSLISQVADLRTQNEQLQASLTAATTERSNSAAQIDALLATNRTLVAQNKAVRAQLDAVIDYLHTLGLEVPQVAIPPTEAPTGPKGHATTPGSSPPPSPKPTLAPAPTVGPTPTDPGPAHRPPPGIICQLVPMLCPQGTR